MCEAESPELTTQERGHDCGVKAVADQGAPHGVFGEVLEGTDASSVPLLGSPRVAWQEPHEDFPFGGAGDSRQGAVVACRGSLRDEAKVVVVRVRRETAAVPLIQCQHMRSHTMQPWGAGRRPTPRYGSGERGERCLWVLG